MCGADERRAKGHRFLEPAHHTTACILRLASPITLATRHLLSRAQIPHYGLNGSLGVFFTTTPYLMALSTALQRFQSYVTRFTETGYNNMGGGWMTLGRHPRDASLPGAAPPESGQSRCYTGKGLHLMNESDVEWQVSELKVWQPFQCSMILKPLLIVQ